MEKKELSAFPIGEPNVNLAQYFIGESFVAPLATEQIPTFNVTFSPACRNNWHIHHARKDGGQMLICIFGRGWYQEWVRSGARLLTMMPMGSWDEKEVESGVSCSLVHKRLEEIGY